MFARLVFSRCVGIQFLVKLSTDLGLPERDAYEAELQKVNRMKEIQVQVRRSLPCPRCLVEHLFRLTSSARQVQIRAAT